MGIALGILIVTSIAYGLICVLAERFRKQALIASEDARIEKAAHDKWVIQMHEGNDLPLAFNHGGSVIYEARIDQAEDGVFYYTNLQPPKGQRMRRTRATYETVSDVRPVPASDRLRAI